MRVIAKNLLEQRIGKTITIDDAKEPLHLRALEKHYVRGTECDPWNCTIANAAKDRPDVAFCMVWQTVAYVVFKNDLTVARRYDMRGSVHRIIQPEKLVKRHDNKTMKIPPGGFDITLIKPPTNRRLLASMTPAERVRFQKTKRASSERRKGKEPKRRYRRSISSVRKNVLSAFLAGAGQTFKDEGGKP